VTYGIEGSPGIDAAERPSCASAYFNGFGRISPLGWTYVSSRKMDGIPANSDPGFAVSSANPSQ
tara:strand:+ start:4468 stop:4659 length:192 start_codon:yes stop_codon:yes gene_type:complete